MKSMKKGHNGLRGFTIVELLAVISIITISTGIFIPAVREVTRVLSTLLLLGLFMLLVKKRLKVP